METLKVYERVSQGGLLAIQYIQKIESDYCDTAVDKLLTVGIAILYPTSGTMNSI